MDEMPRFALRPEPTARLGYELYLWHEQEGWTGWVQLRCYAQKVDGAPSGMLSCAHEHELVELGPVTP